MTPTASDPRPRPFHLLAKPTGATCNLDCAYCFYLAKEMLYPGSRFRMAEELLDIYVRELLAAHGDNDVVIAWQGGEPTMMGLPFFRRSVEVVERYRRPGTGVTYTIQTNGTLLDAEWGHFFAQHRFLVGISIDGPRGLHDAYRRDRGGAPIFDRVMRGLAYLRAANVEFNILATVNRLNGDAPLEVYRFLRDDCGGRYLQFIPIVERPPGPRIDVPLTALARRSNGTELVAPGSPAPSPQALASDHSVKPEQYGRFLSRVFDEWLHRDVGHVFVQDFDAALANWVGVTPGLCVHAETCGSALALEHNGDVYSCDHFVDPEHLLGNLSEVSLLELVESPRQRQFGRDKRDMLPRQCRECPVRRACNGGCPKDRFLRTRDGEGGLNYLCAGYFAFFSHVAPAVKIMAELISEGRAPAEVVAYGGPCHDAASA